MPDPRPPEALELFAKRVRNRPTLRRLDDAALEAFDAFAAAGVGALLLKGPVLARVLYTAREHRAYSDVDLLVAPGDVEKARHTLAGLGYTDVSAGLGVEDFAGDLHDESWVRIAPQGDSGVSIDLHRQMPGSKATPHVAWEALREHLAWTELEGRRLPTLSTEGLAMHLALHVAQHGTWARRPLEDLEKGLERWSPDLWRGAASLAEEIGATEAFAAGLRLTPRGASLAHDLLLPPTDQRLWEIEHHHERPRGTFHLDALREARTFQERLSVLRRSLLPRRDWIAWQYPWARRGAPHLAAAYGLHLTRTPVWAVRAWRFRRRARRAQ